MQLEAVTSKTPKQIKKKLFLLLSMDVYRTRALTTQLSITVRIKIESKKKSVEEGEKRRESSERNLKVIS
jgi:hypothetical protein